jgi:hypothetical protein
MSSILRFARLLGITVAALAITPVVTVAQAPRPDFPGAKQQEPRPNFEPAIKPLRAAPPANFPGLVTPDEALAGASQVANPAAKAKTSPSTSKSTSKRHAQHIHGKHHHAS